MEAIKLQSQLKMLPHFLTEVVEKKAKNRY